MSEIEKEDWIKNCKHEMCECVNCGFEVPSPHYYARLEQRIVELEEKLLESKNNVEFFKKALTESIGAEGRCNIRLENSWEKVSVKRLAKEIYSWGKVLGSIGYDQSEDLATNIIRFLEEDGV
jgi:hypothetical protein